MRWLYESRYYRENNKERLEKHSWFFRNALVRSRYENIPKGIHRTFESLERFMNLAVFGIPAAIRNRTFHIRWNEPLRHDDISDGTKCQNDVLETPLSFSELLSLKEMAIIRLIASDSNLPEKVPRIMQPGVINYPKK